MTDPALSSRFRGVLRDLTWLEELWPDLLESRIPGTARPWREPGMTPERAAELAAERAEEEMEVHTDLPMHLRARAPEVLGESPAPAHIDILDALSDLLMTMDLLAEHLATTLGMDRPPHASSAFADPTPYLRFIRENLAAAAEEDPEILDAASDKCRDQVASVSQSLALLRDGQTLKAPCPWCRGVTPHSPAGGAHTLRVRVIPWLDDETPAVVCHNDTCDPPEADCGTRHRGRPAWPSWEWDWLAKRLEEAA